MAKKAQVPVWVIGMPQPLSHEHETPVNPEAGGLACTHDRGAKLRFRSSRQNFVGIKDEYPLVAEGKIFQRPVFLFRPGAIEFELHDLGAKLLRDAWGAVGAIGIDYENFVCPADRFEA